MTSSLDGKDSLFYPGMRRWDGRNRVTNNWNTLNNDHELCFPNGDIKVYLQEPGQTARSPSFRVHSSQIALKGLQCLVDRSVKVPTSFSSPLRSHSGRKKRAEAFELYLPAPPGASKKHSMNHHLDTRNLFAWIYNIPLTGKTLGGSLTGLLQRMNFLRAAEEAANQKDLMSYMEYQGYLDFRECADHALAALFFAETFEIEHLWVDAFAHCVGMHHKLHDSLEFKSISPTSKATILKARLEMDVRLDRVSRSVMNFFELDLSGAHLGLHQTAREHFDRFRSFLHGYYIETYGFWPPASFGSGLQGQRTLYHSMYADFRCLYHFLVDPSSTPTIKNNKPAEGGLCVLQIIEAFDGRHRFETLPHPMPLIPLLEEAEKSLNLPRERRNSLNPLRRRKAEREFREKVAGKALIDASNRDWSVSSNLLVRRVEQFETRNVADEFEDVSLVDGRKVRWILIYAILQTLVSVTYAPKEVRDPEGLSYALCCHPPKVMPWLVGNAGAAKTAGNTLKLKTTELEPDINYLQTSSSSSSLSSRALKERRKSLPLSIVSNTSTSSLRGLLMSRTPSANTTKTTTTVSKPAFCEIFVHGYGNGLNEAKTVQKNESDETITETEPEQADMHISPGTLVSRESSKSSGYSRSTENKGGGDDDDDDLTEMDHLSVGGDDTNPSSGIPKVLDMDQELQGVHINTATWDAFLAE